MSQNEWINAVQRLHAQQQAFALVTVLRVQPPASAKVGDKALVTAEGAIHGWIGGGCAQPAVIKTVRAALADGQARHIRIAPTDETAERTLGDVLEFGMACHSGGTLEMFVDPVLPAAQLTVLGDSPVARALAMLAPRLDFSVTVIAEGACAQDFPEARTVMPSDNVEQVRELVRPEGLAIVATQGRRDLQGLKTALALRPRKLWFVASARKAGVIRQSLISAGEDRAQVDAIVAPAGVPVGAQTAEEIALSILMAVVAERRTRSEATTSTSSKSCCGGAAAKADLATVDQEAPAPQVPVAPIPEVSAKTTPSCCGG
ncbi:XdhC family protein [Hydrogenophaga sp.]|uniref:XdhC family protein n=1 Tax=Hydrogenophaga sp. TaxID=1904254 RepID=UPI00271F1EA6|nr:XdhC family protein [Hydrogenophaga sp.]MDO8904201.1 XdhC family protein [Hydrogenophaga sp.]